MSVYIGLKLLSDGQIFQKLHVCDILTLLLILTYRLRRLLWITVELVNDIVKQVHVRYRGLC